MQDARISVLDRSSPEQEAAQFRAAAPSKARNPGRPLDLDWALAGHINTSAIERRVESLGPRRAVKGEAQTAWLFKAISLIDLTTLAGDDTGARVARLCGKARQPLRPDLVEALDLAGQAPRVAAVCVYHAQIAAAKRALTGSGIPVCAVSTGFPTGQLPLELRLAQVRAAVAEGADEIDIVIHRPLALTGRWQELYDEVAACKDACGEASMKTILATGDLGSLALVAATSRVCLLAGSDFIKTSTGKEKVNATLPVGLVMLRAIRDYHARTGIAAGFKPAGGIARAKDAIAWLRLMREELGLEWLDRGRFRLGASSVLADIERQIEHRVTGRYSSFRRHPMA
jgi:deoxyribose-phosphate aldolase